MNAHTAHMRCPACGHEYLLEPAAVMRRADGTVARYFGSAYDFCPACDETPEEIQTDATPQPAKEAT